MNLFGSCSALPLTTMNNVIALISLILGLVILALTATLSGLGAVGGVNPRSSIAPRRRAHQPGPLSCQMAHLGENVVERSDTSSRSPSPKK